MWNRRMTNKLWQWNNENRNKNNKQMYLEIMQELEIQRAETMYWWRVLFTLLETFSGKVAVTNTIMQQTA